MSGQDPSLEAAGEAPVEAALEVGGAAPPRPGSGASEPLVVAAVATGGVLGAEARYGLGRVWPHTATEFAWSTLLVNLVGCLLIGILMVSLTEVLHPHPLVRPFLGVGVLGGFTTFSTYAVDVIRLVDAGRGGAAIGYLLLTPTAAVSAVWIGIAGTRRLAGTRSGSWVGVAR